MFKRTREVFLVVSLVFLLFLPAVLAQSAEEASSSLSEAKGAIGQMEKAGLPTTRVKDLLAQANSTYQAQLALNRTGRNPDFSRVVELTSEIKRLKEEAFKVHDQLQVLEKRIEELEKKNLNLGEVKKSFEEAKKEYRTERFDKASKKVEKTYQEISEAQAVSTKARAYYEATREGVTAFVKGNWKLLLVAAVVLSVGGYIGWKEIKFYKLKKRKRKLERRKEVLQNLIEDTQQEYFDKGEMAEATYKVRTSKYGDMIRDINRQLPLINEELQNRRVFFQGLG